MAIEKMKFVSACTDPGHRDEMLLAGMNTGLLQPVIATKIINDDNNGSVISTENPYQDYVQTFKSIAHAVGCDLNIKEKITSSYTNAEIEAYIKELNEEFGLDSVTQSETLSPDDEKALKELSVLNFEKMHACNYLNHLVRYQWIALRSYLCIVKRCLYYIVYIPQHNMCGSCM